MTQNRHSKTRDVVVDVVRHVGIRASNYDALLFRITEKEKRKKEIENKNDVFKFGNALIAGGVGGVGVSSLRWVWGLKGCI